MDNIAYFDLLPSETISQLFLSLIDKNDIKTLKLVCKKFKEICETTPFWNKYFVNCLFPNRCSLYLTQGNNAKNDCLTLIDFMNNIHKIKEWRINKPSDNPIEEILYPCNQEIEIPCLTSDAKNYIFSEEEGAIICLNLITSKIIELPDITTDDMNNNPFLFVADKSLVCQQNQGIVIYNLDEGPIHYLPKSNCFVVNPHQTTQPYAQNYHLKILYIKEDQVAINTWNTLSGVCVESHEDIISLKDLEKYSRIEIGEENLFLFAKDKIVIINIHSKKQTIIEQPYSKHVICNDFLIAINGQTIDIWDFRKQLHEQLDSLNVVGGQILSIQKKERYCYISTTAASLVYDTLTQQLRVNREYFTPNETTKITLKDHYLISRMTEPPAFSEEDEEPQEITEENYIWTIFNLKNNQAIQMSSTDKNLEVKHSFCINQETILDLHKGQEFVFKIPTLLYPNYVTRWFDKGVLFKYTYPDLLNGEINTLFQIVHFTPECEKAVDQPLILSAPRTVEED